MKKFLLATILLGSKAVFGQLLGMSTFQLFDDNSYKMTVDTEKEAVEKYLKVLAANGRDTSVNVINWGNNPIIFDSFKSEIKGMVVIGIVLKSESKYDILFAIIPNEDTTFFEVLNKDGDLVKLIYEKQGF